MLINGFLLNFTKGANNKGLFIKGIYKRVYQGVLSKHNTLNKLVYLGKSCSY